MEDELPIAHQDNVAIVKGSTPGSMDKCGVLRAAVLDIPRTVLTSQFGLRLRRDGGILGIQVGTVECVGVAFEGKRNGFCLVGRLADGRECAPALRRDLYPRIDGARVVGCRLR